MLSKEDQRRFEQITRQLRATDPAFFARLDDRVRGRRTRILLLLTILLWASLPAMIVLGGGVAGAICGITLLVNGGLMWRARRRFR
ncbi:hypothetical protein GCM10027290_57110 [Micromonospora sonneratiae]|uniref:DUF3040 domain-containing protein n=1 Tax=Micromonospora sonneratiae TaxID=1184706 RepID=A0ABW3YG33_9ACTN